MKKNKFFCILIVLFIVYILSSGYAAFEKNVTIGNVASVVRFEENIRVTSFTYSSATNSGASTYLEYGKKILSTNVNMPNENSTITYEVTVTNYGNTEMGIYALTGLPSNLTYSVTDYTLHDKICNSSGSCTLGASKTFNLTVSYTSDGYDSSNTEYSLNIGVDFRSFYTVTYENITNNGYPTDVIVGGNLVVDFGSSMTTSPLVYLDGQVLSTSLYSFSSGVLTYNNVTGNVKINGLFLSSIAVTTAPTKTKYNEGDVFDPSGMVVTATYSDGTTAEVTGYTFSPDGELTEDNTTISISYTEDGVTKTTTYDVVVSKMIKITLVSDLDVNDNPTPYIDCVGVGDTAGTYEVPFGTEVYVGFSHYYTSTRTSIYFNGSQVKNGGGDSGGSYGVEYGFTATSDITIAFDYYTAYIVDSTSKMVKSIAVTTPPNKTEYLSGDTFDPTGMVVTATYSDGTTEEITDYSYYSGITKSTTSINISYSYGGPTVSTSVPISVTPVLLTITITGSGYSSRCYASYSSTSYTSSSTFTVYRGDSIYLYAKKSGGSAQIIMNNEVIKTATSSWTYYHYYPESDATINLNYVASGSNYSSTITITEP